MDDIMPSERDKYFIRWLEEKFKSQDEKLEANTNLTKEVLRQQKTLSNRITKVETKVVNEDKLPPFYRDPKVIQTIMYVALAFLLLVAAVTKFDVGSLI